MKTILITGASGFIGRSICRTLIKDYQIIAFTKQHALNLDSKCIQVYGNMEDGSILNEICKKYRPEVVIHCAGLAHQKITNPLTSEQYHKINCESTIRLAKEAIKANPNVWFVFLSSSSVYGEKQKKRIRETDPYSPTSDYAISKMNAEKKLKELFDGCNSLKIDILRLAPVYDANWSLNIDKRVFAPYKLFYIKYGSGEQKMSMVNRQNLVDFIEFRLKQNKEISLYSVFNVCDKNPYSFNEIIRIFKKSGLQPKCITVGVPLAVAFFLVKAVGLLLKKKSEWSRSIYEKLSNSLVFDNQQMLKTGYQPKHTLSSVFDIDKVMDKIMDRSF